MIDGFIGRSECVTRATISGIGLFALCSVRDMVSGTGRKNRPGVGCTVVFSLVVGANFLAFVIHERTGRVGMKVAWTGRRTGDGTSPQNQPWSIMLLYRTIVSSGFIALATLAGCDGAESTNLSQQAALLGPSAEPGASSSAETATGDSATGADLSELAVPAIDWQPCVADDGSNDPLYECAQMTVPLDYDRPYGRTIEIAVARLPASGSDKIGSILLNPGGPGGSGVELVRAIGTELFSAEVRAGFDLIGFDPRGVGQSAPLRCFATLDEALAVLPPFAFPVTRDEVAVARKSAKALGRACDQNGTEILAHMSTANVARDMELMRRAVGDDGLTFAGYSYGSLVGTTYANMFPDKVRAVIVDAVLDPVAWTTGRSRHERRTVPFTTRSRSAQGAQETLEEFFRLCDQAGAAECAMAGDAAGRYADIAAALLQEPLVVDPGSGDSFQITYADVIRYSLRALYDANSWRSFAHTLAWFESLLAGREHADNSPESAAAVQRLREQIAAAGRSGKAARYQSAADSDQREEYPNFVESFSGVSCPETPNPRNFKFWPRAVETGPYGYFDAVWTWTSIDCAYWPVRDRDRYKGPFNKRTANPVLVASTLYDPATPYHGAQLVDALLPNARLLTVQGWGHTTLFVSQCADRIVNQYLLDPQSVPRRTTCAFDRGPFEPETADELAEGSSSTSREALRKEALRHISPGSGIAR